MKLYENVVIGNFLYGLGVSIGKKLKTGYLPSAVSLLQQGPEDKALGDLLLDFPGVLRLIEFKAKGNYSRKEANKCRMLSMAIGDNLVMREVSRKVHWYIESSQSTEYGVEIFQSPYLDAFETKVRRRQPFVLEKIVGSIADEALMPREQEKAQTEKDYLKFVRWHQGVGETGAGALAVLVESNGAIHFAALEDLMELNLSREKCIELRRELDMKLEKVMLIDSPEIQREHGVSYGR